MVAATKTQMVRLRDFKDSILIAANIPTPERTVVADLKGDIGTVSLTQTLQNLVQDYVSIGMPVLTGFAGQVFDDAQATMYRDAKNKLEQATELLYKGENLTADRLAANLETEEANDIRKKFANIGDGDKRYQELVEAGKSFLQLQREAMDIALKRYTDINAYAPGKQLIDLGRVVSVLGVHDSPTWDLKQEMKRGVQEIRYGHKKKGKLRFAYFGGYNYHEEEYKQDAPDELIMKPAPDVLGNFLEKTPFDVLLFSGARNVVKMAIDNINLNKSRKLFGSNKSGIRDRVIIVTDPNEQFPKIEYDGVNTIVTGANYNYGDKGKVVLIDPLERNVAILRYSVGGNIDSADKLSGKKGMLDDAHFELIKAHNFANGKGFDLSDIARKHMSIAGHISTSLIRGLEAVSAPETRGALRKAIPYIVAGAVGAAAGSLTTAFAISASKKAEMDSGLVDTVNKLELDLKKKDGEIKVRDASVKEQQRLINEYEQMIDQYVEQKSK